MQKTVLITGATKGIGLAISQRLTQSGYQVIGIARHHCDTFPGLLFTCDLSDAEATQTTLNLIKQQHPTILYIVNNVGIALAQPLGAIDIKALHHVFDLTVRTAVQTVQTFLPNMQQAHFGRIINMASKSSRGADSRSSYSAAKGALISLARTWAIELAPYQICVNSVSPGPIATDLFREKHPKGSLEEQRVIEQTLLKRLGTSEEVAALVEFLFQTEASYITGQDLGVDGGLLA